MTSAAASSGHRKMSDPDLEWAQREVGGVGARPLSSRAPIAHSPNREGHWFCHGGDEDLRSHVPDCKTTELKNGAYSCTLVLDRARVREQYRDLLGIHDSWFLRSRAIYDLPHTLAGTAPRRHGTLATASHCSWRWRCCVQGRCSDSWSPRCCCRSWRSISTTGVVGRDEVGDGGAAVDGGVLCGRRSVR